jgi:hypothetical protein
MMILVLKYALANGLFGSLGFQPLSPHSSKARPFGTYTGWQRWQKWDNCNTSSIE